MSDIKGDGAATDSAGLYDASRARTIDLVRHADPATPVEACPGWTVGAMVAHLAGGLGDFLARRFDLAEGDNFGERTVRERRDQSVADSLAEWEKHRAMAEEMLASPMGDVLVAEVISHEQDLRTALDRPGAREDPAVRAGLRRPLQEVDKRLRESGGPAIQVVVDGEPLILGAGEPTTTLTVSAYELLRTIGGRRTREQVRALAWEGDGAEAAVDALAVFGSFRQGTPLPE
jgi:uncharacterized protein (TIGR03083 family)